MNSDLVAVAKIVKSRGLRGELVADILTDFPERFNGLESVVALFPDRAERELKIERFTAVSILNFQFSIRASRATGSSSRRASPHRPHRSSGADSVCSSLG